MEKNNETQQTCGVTWVDLMLPSMLSSTFPWLNTSDIALGSYGSKNEGYFDPWAFLTAVKKKVVSMCFLLCVLIGMLCRQWLKELLISQGLLQTQYCHQVVHTLVLRLTM